jgi:hypothetical protein
MYRFGVCSRATDRAPCGASSCITCDFVPQWRLPQWRSFNKTYNRTAASCLQAGNATKHQHSKCASDHHPPSVSFTFIRKSTHLSRISGLNALLGSRTCAALPANCLRGLRATAASRAGSESFASARSTARRKESRCAESRLVPRSGCWGSCSTAPHAMDALWTRQKPARAAARYRRFNFAMRADAARFHSGRGSKLP